MAEYIFTESLCKGRLAFDRIARLQNFIINCEDDDVVIRVRSSGRVGLTFVFMLATLHLIAKEHGKNFKWLFGGCLTYTSAPLRGAVKHPPNNSLKLG